MGGYETMAIIRTGHAVGIRGPPGSASVPCPSSDAAQVGMTGRYRQDGLGNISDRRWRRDLWQWDKSAAGQEHPAQWKALASIQVQDGVWGFRRSGVGSQQTFASFTGLESGTEKDLFKHRTLFISPFWYHVYAPSVVPLGTEPRPGVIGAPLHVFLKPPSPSITFSASSLRSRSCPLRP